MSSKDLRPLEQLPELRKFLPKRLFEMLQANPSDNMHPICFEYQNCDEGFPCRACIFKGDHTPSPGTEGPWGEGNTWVPDSTWSYFKRFY